ncbi:tetratricopeptide repeat protein [Minwuia sp.]|uniref:tetratricopeptide repeat protein n=1 Tax=Minwuia sp. TaxID=2493630 RepID=UPI003A90F37A
MMLDDRYGLELSTQSNAARDAYVDGVDRLLAADGGAEHAFQRAIDADPEFSLAHVALARSFQFLGDGRAARTAIGRAKDGGAALTDREAAHRTVMTDLIEGRMAEAYGGIRRHLLDHPRDAVVAQTCCGVFGLIGFSGQRGREAEQLAFTTSLLPDYGDDWWFLGQHAFSQVEAGQTDVARDSIERALEGRPRSAHNVHIRAHVDYEAGDTDAGLRRVTDWMPDYEREGILHCHLSWHVALTHLAQGRINAMWRTYEAAVKPGGAWGPSINVITDSAALLYRAQVAGVDVPAAQWQHLSDYAAATFPRTGIGFVDAHAAIIFAFAGNDGQLNRIIDGAKGPAADTVRAIAVAFRDLAQDDAAGATAALVAIMAEHERIGGSRAQRDLLEFALLNALLRQGQTAEARRLLAMRRPVHAADRVVADL